MARGQGSRKLGTGRGSLNHGDGHGDYWSAIQRTLNPLYLLLLFAGFTLDAFRFRLYALLLLLGLPVLDQKLPLLPTLFVELPLRLPASS